MRLQRDRFKAESFRINVQILIRHKKEIVFLRGPQPAQSRKDHDFLRLQHLPHLRSKCADYALRHFGIHAIGGGVKIGQQRIRLSLSPKRKSPIRRIDGISLVRKR